VISQARFEPLGELFAAGVPTDFGELSALPVQSDFVNSRFANRGTSVSDAIWAASRGSEAMTPISPGHR